jgi:hypothetical protein
VVRNVAPCFPNGLDDSLDAMHIVLPTLPMRLP